MERRGAGDGAKRPGLDRPQRDFSAPDQLGGSGQPAALHDPCDGIRVTGVVEPGQRPLESPTHRSGIVSREFPEPCVGVNGRDAERAQLSFREVAKVEGDEQISARGDRGGEHVLVVPVGKRVLDVRRSGVRFGPPTVHRVRLVSNRLLSRRTMIAPDGPRPFLQHARRPNGIERALRRRPQKRAASERREQDAGVKERASHLRADRRGGFVMDAHVQERRAGTQTLASAATRSIVEPDFMELPKMTPRLSRNESDGLVHDRESALPRLREIMRRLRDPDGCPWDREQDFSTIAPYTIEEAYEVADAIERDARDDLRDELGDLLLQVVYHSQMAEERGWFDFDDVARGSADKMLNRHPHVFADAPGVETADAQTVNWEAMKAQERAAKGVVRDGALDGVPVGLPALTRATKLTSRAARVGFDWPEAGPVLDKLQEEARELVQARESLSADAVEDEFGDLLFVLANLGRHLGADPEKALRRTNAKFERRFREIEKRLRTQGRRVEDATLAEMDALWNSIKADERAGTPYATE